MYKRRNFDIGLDGTLTKNENEHFSFFLINLLIEFFSIFDILLKLLNQVVTPPKLEKMNSVVTTEGKKLKSELSTRFFGLKG